MSVGIPFHDFFLTKKKKMNTIVHPVMFEEPAEISVKFYNEIIEPELVHDRFAGLSKSEIKYLMRTSDVKRSVLK